jgi:hypothetical protein
MSTKLPFRLLALAIALIPWVIVAQEPRPAPTPMPAPAPVADTMFFVSSGAPLMPVGGQVRVLRGESAVLGEVVKDKPYTADAVTESTQILADGNRVTNRNETRIYRDSQGRTRREQTLGGLGVWRTANEPATMITINDPVANVSYFLDPVAHAAQELKQFHLQLDPNATWTRAVPPPGEPGDAASPAPPPGFVVTQRFSADAGGAQGFAVTQRLPAEGAPPPAGPGPQTFELARAAGTVSVGPAGPPGAIVGGAIAQGAGVATFAPAGFGPVNAFAAGPGETTDLGEQVLEGVLAHGARETHTIPAGAIGNERPIEIVAEEWYSKDIEAIVSRRTYDPRFGETTYRLANVVREEPSPDLFVVPQGYDLRKPQQIETTVEPGGSPGQHVERRVFVVQPKPEDADK